jgi:hypothetical protein
MKSIPSTSSSDRGYHTAYVIVLLLLFLSVGFMGVRQGSGNLENNFYQKNLLIENFNRIRLKLGSQQTIIWTITRMCSPFHGSL